MKKIYITIKLIFVFTFVQAQIKTGGSPNLKISTGYNNPNNANIGNVGDLYLQNDNQVGKIYQKVHGSNNYVGWVQLDTVGSNGWKLTGNAGTNPSVNYIGTSDGTNFIIQPSTGNVGIGTINPTNKLHVEGSVLTDRVTSNGYTGFVSQGIVPNLGVNGTVLNWNDTLKKTFATNGIVVDENSNLYYFNAIIDSNSSGSSFNMFYSLDDSLPCYKIATSASNSLTSNKALINLVADYKAEIEFANATTLDKEDLELKPNSFTFYSETQNTTTGLYGDTLGVGIVNDGDTIFKVYNKVVSITDGTQGNGKVLTSDVNGLASWQSPYLTGSATLDFGAISPNGHQVLTITVSGAALGDVVCLGIPNTSMNDHASFVAWVSATNTVSVKCFNFDGTSFDPASGVFNVKILK